MTPRLTKEVREIAPIFFLTTFIMIMPYLVWGHSAGMFGYIPFVLGSAFLAAHVFGHEFQHKTLWLVLSQPVPRRAIWEDKMLVVGAGIVLNITLLLGCLRVYNWGEFSPLAFVFIPLFAFCVTPWFTLLTRSSLVGAITSMAVPFMLMACAELIAEFFTERPSDVRFLIFLCIFIPLGIAYAGLSCWLGYVAFQRAQVRDVAGQELRFPSWFEDLLGRTFARRSPRPRTPFMALFLKELRLQQVSFLLAAIFLMLAFLGYAAGAIHRATGQMIIGADYLFYLPVLWLVGGAIAVAEERTLGISDWHLTLPCSAAKQWCMKMFVTLTTNFMLGVVLPLLMFFVIRGLMTGGADKQEPGSWLILFLLALLQLLVTSLAMYVGSLSSSTLRSILLAMGLFVFGCTFIPLSAWLVETQKVIWRDSPFMVAAAYNFGGIRGLALIVAFGECLFICLLQVLAFSNFRMVALSRGRMAMQLIGNLLLALILVFITIAVWGLHRTLLIDHHPLFTR